MFNKAGHMQTGAAGEEAAAAYVRSLGWRLVERNWRPSGRFAGLELDIVAMDGSCLVFVEVKSRRDRGAITGAFEDGIPVHAAFTRKKRDTVLRAARLYLSEKELWRLPCRFDYIGVQFAGNGSHQVEHQRHVIEAGNFVDCGHAAWQPW